MQIEQRNSVRHFIMKDALLKIKKGDLWKEYEVIIKDMNDDSVRINCMSEISFGEDLFLEIPGDLNLNNKMTLSLSLNRVQHRSNSIDYNFQIKNLDVNQSEEIRMFLEKFEESKRRMLVEAVAVSAEHRKSSRVPVDFKIKIEGEKEVTGSLVNISQTGFVIEINQSLKIGSVYVLQIDCSTSFKTTEVKVHAKIVWEKLKDDKSYIYGSQIVEAEENAESVLEKIIDHAENLYYRVPQDKQFSGEQMDPLAERRRWLMERTPAKNFDHIKHFSIDPNGIKGNVENLIGASQMPLGVAGPIKVNGEHAQGIYYVPFATTEGTLVATYERGMLAITKAGGANVVVTKDVLDVDPVFKFRSVFEAKDFINWLKDNYEYIKHEAEKTTRYGTLLEIRPYPMGSDVMLNFRYNTGDAMGMNMVNIATNSACLYIEKQIKTKGYYLRCNLTSDKKPSFFNLINSYGKEVIAEVTLPKDILRLYLGTTAEKFCDFHRLGILCSIQAGMIGANAHFANGLAAIYMACGQDVAQIVNASGGIFACHKTDDGDLYLSIKIPSLVVGTVGGGTKIGTHKECLELMDCYGEGKSEKFAEIVAATILGGEITIHAALSTGAFIKSHMQKRDLIGRGN